MSQSQGPVCRGLPFVPAWMIFPGAHPSFSAWLPSFLCAWGVALHSSLHAKPGLCLRQLNGNRQRLWISSSQSALHSLLRGMWGGEAKGQGRRGLLIFGGKNPFVGFSHALCLYFLEHGFYFGRKCCNSCTLACPKKSIVICILPEAN